METYRPVSFESKWRDYWLKEKIYAAPSSPEPKKKMYALSMFPYPSGEGLHVGHVRIYTGTDVLARYFRMKGYEVLHPMGWDAFGLPAENAAIKAKKNPQDMVPKNIENFKRQMQSVGLSYDWDREFSTADPEYYRFTQWLFLQFFKLGLLYKKDIPVYFCPFCKTGLAEEEVLSDGTHERCGKTITRKHLPQWLFKITDYADSLLKGLSEGKLDWPNGILEMQRHWIGKDRGLQIEFKEEKSQTKIPVWTRFWETVYGTTFLVLAPEHELVQAIADPKVKEYVKQALAKTDEQRLKEEKQKTGVFTGLFALNPATNARVPIYVADYVLSNVGTGAVMGVPAHDERDLAFAQKYALPIIQVISDEKPGKLVNSGSFNGLEAATIGKQKMAEWLIKEGKGSWQTNYHLRDWIFSRQRYWGEPIPIVFCKACARAGISYWDTKEYQTDKLIQNNAKLKQKTSKRLKRIQEFMAGYFPLKESELPLKLPYIKHYEPTGTGESPLSVVSDWVETTCPHCGGKAQRETDTMPNWAGSCWYFLRFAIDNTSGVLSGNTPEVLLNSPYLPVDWYLGGAEHAVLHLLYARFWMHVLNDLNLINFREPFKRLRNVGMVLAEDHHKMSKSIGNVINPDSVVKKFGADTLRVYEMFMAPFSQEIAWSVSSLLGCYRFLNKVYQLMNDSARIAKPEEKPDIQLEAELQTLIHKVESDIANVKFNTAIASLMEFTNRWQKGKLSLTGAQKFTQLLAPFAPFLAEELWQNRFKHNTSVHISVWPKADEQAKIKVNLTVPVQVNGKVRALLSVNSQTAFNQSEIEKLAKQNERVAKYLEGKKYRTHYVAGKILNYIVE